MTLWGQLQNLCADSIVAENIYHNDPVGSTSEQKIQHHTELRALYHNDPVGSTSELNLPQGRQGNGYTIMTLWGQLQNTAAVLDNGNDRIP